MSATLLTNMQLNALCAQIIMGWTLRQRREAYDVWVDRAGNIITSPAIFSPSETISSAYEMETELEKQHKEHEYAMVLANDLGVARYYFLIHATPRQRVLAALKTYGVDAK